MLGVQLFWGNASFNHLGVMATATAPYANMTADKDSINRPLSTFGFASKITAFAAIKAVILFHINHGITSTVAVVASEASEAAVVVEVRCLRPDFAALPLLMAHHQAE